MIILVINIVLIPKMLDHGDFDDSSMMLLLLIIIVRDYVLDEIMGGIFSGTGVAA